MPVWFGDVTSVGMCVLHNPESPLQTLSPGFYFGEVGRAEDIKAPLPGLRGALT